MMKIEDLDVLLPEKRIIRIGGKDIDVSFIPCAITFEVDKIIRELTTISKETILDNGEGTKRAFNLSVKLCSVFCEHKFPELDETWFMENTDPIQIKHFSSAIQEALQRSYLGIVGNSKNLKAPKKERK
jgi:hypothetical protein